MSVCAGARLSACLSARRRMRVRASVRPCAGAPARMLLIADATVAEALAREELGRVSGRANGQRQRAAC